MGSIYARFEDTFSTSQNGTVPKPTAGDVTSNKVLRADGSWVQQSGGGGSSHTYSTTEQVVGTWINGKPVYEKSKYLTNHALSSGANTISLGISSIDTVIDINILVTNSGHTTVRKPNITQTSTSSDNIYFIYDYINDTLTLTTTGSWGSPNIVIVARYTKTTD